jgi:hypothetical protein
MCVCFKKKNLELPLMLFEGAELPFVLRIFAACRAGLSKGNLSESRVTSSVLKKKIPLDQSKFISTTAEGF